MKSKNKIYCIHPHDRTTLFLERIVNHLRRQFKEDFHCFKVKLNEASHTDCLESIKQQQGNFILFLGHGRSDSLYGACGDKGDDFISPVAQESSSAYYQKEQFITADNIEVFASNIVLSLSCNSNEKGEKCLGALAIKAGVKSFIGFGDIPTDFDDELDFTLREIAIFKGIINKIIKTSITISFKKGFCVGQLVDVIKIVTNQEIQNLIVHHQGIKYRHRIAKHLFLFKEEIKLFGNMYEKL